MLSLCFWLRGPSPKQLKKERKAEIARAERARLRALSPAQLKKEYKENFTTNLIAGIISGTIVIGFIVVFL